MTKFAQFALVLEGLASFAAGLYFLNEGRAGVGIVLLILGLFSTVAVLANVSAQVEPSELDKRVQEVQARISAMPPGERAELEAWVRTTEQRLNGLGFRDPEPPVRR